MQSIKIPEMTKNLYARFILMYTKKLVNMCTKFWENVLTDFWFMELPSNWHDQGQSMHKQTRSNRVESRQNLCKIYKNCSLKSPFSAKFQVVFKGGHNGSLQYWRNHPVGKRPQWRKRMPINKWNNLRYVLSWSLTYLAHCIPLSHFNLFIPFLY